MYFDACLKFDAFLLMKSAVSSVNVPAYDSFDVYFMPVMFLV